MSTRIKKALVIIIFAIVMFSALRAGSVDLSLAQVAVLPVLLLAAWQLSILGVKIKKSFLLVALLMGVTGVALSYNVERLTSGGVYVARFKDDPLETISRIFRAQLSKILEPLESIDALRFPSAVRDVSHATKIIAEEGKDALIWGQSNWVHLTVRSKRNDQLNDIFPDFNFSDLGVPRLGEFYFIESPNDLGLNLNATTHTDVFLGYFLGGELFDEIERKEVFYSLAATTKSFWSSNSHKAFPMWRLANLQFREAFVSGNYQTSELGCAIENYQIALRHLNKNNFHMNPNLYGAILNNFSLALMLKSYLEGNEELRKMYLKGFLRARQTKGPESELSVEFSVRDAIKYNLHLLHTLGEHKSKKMDRRLSKKLDDKKKRKQQ